MATASVKGKKNIVVCCDGTGNEFSECNSNVVKIYTAARIDNEQVGYYHPGVGTMGSPLAQGALGNWWSKVRGLGFGAGFMDHVEDAYRYLMDVYDDGDKIFLFGFSRGAYTVRALAAILYSYGLLCKGNEGHIPYVWKLFTDEMQAATKSNKAGGAGEKQTSLPIHSGFKATFSRCPNLHFVGLWDTVSSVGWVTEPVKLLYSAQNPSIQRGRHAVSIDERRCFFLDNLWGPALGPAEKDYPKWKQEMRDLAEATNDPSFLTLEQDIFQAWFAGVHSDVGGSYPQGVSALSNLTLAWMLREAETAGLQVVEKRKQMVFGLPEEPGAGEVDLRLPAAGFFKKPDSDWRTQRINTSLHGSWWLLEVLPHGYYDKDDAGKVKIRFPLGRMRKVPYGSVIHGSVVARMKEQDSTYRPSNLLEGELVPHAETKLDGTEVAEFYVYRKPLEQGTSVSKITEKRVVMAALALVFVAGVTLIARSSS